MPVICIDHSKKSSLIQKKGLPYLVQQKQHRILKTQGGVVQNVFFEIFSIPPHRGFSFEYPPSPTPIEVPVPPCT